jgi:hypothetical protein
VVVIVARPIFVKGRGPGGLNAPDDAFVGQDPEGVVNRLFGNGPDLGAHFLGECVRRGVGAMRDRPKHSDALGGD